MHQHNIKSNFLQHHSIPILLKSYSIPIVCGLALPLFITLLHIDKVSAATCRLDVTVPTGTAFSSADEYKTYQTSLNQDGTSSYRVVVTTTDPSIFTAAPSLSLSIDGGQSSTSEKVLAKYGDVNYSSHTVKINATGVESYALALSNVKVTGPSNLTGVSNTKGSSFDDNVWGYSWGMTSAENANLTYNSSVNSNLTGDSISENAVEFTRKLVFATKFGESAADGTYHASATLSLTATPATIVDTYTHWNDMVYMQDITPEACNSVSTGATATLEDIRNGGTYTVKKLSDGKCWMTQNLRLTGDNSKGASGLAVTSCDSNIDGLFVVPTSELWSDTAATTNKAYYNNNTTYGAYYTYYTATAGTNPSSGDASYDICPKNWRLPTKAEYGTLRGNGTAKDGTWSSNSTTSGYWIGGIANASTAAFWYAAGNVSSGSLSNAGTGGHYWSSTAENSDYAYNLYFGSSGTTNISYGSKHVGYSVRCVAQ